jgi:hypothetical protein
VTTGVEGSTGVLVVEVGRARDDTGVDAGVEDVDLVLGCVREPELLGHGRHLGRPGSAHGNELHVIGTPGQSGEVRCRRPHAGADDS